MTDKLFLGFISATGLKATTNKSLATVCVSNKRTDTYNMAAHTSAVPVADALAADMVLVRRDSFEGFDSPEHAAQVAESLGHQLNALESSLRAMGNILGMDPEAPLALLPQHAAHVYAISQSKPEEVVAQMYAERLLEKEAINYIETSYECSTDEKPHLGEVIVTIRRSAGKTPHELRVEAERALETMTLDRDAEKKMKGEARDQRDRMTKHAGHLAAKLKEVQRQFLVKGTLLYDSVTELLGRMKL